MSCLTRFLVFTLAAASLHAATLGTFHTPVGSWQVEFFDEDKPVTVSNFLKYATSGRYQNQFIHRWDDAFVIQGGGWRVDTSGQQWQIAPVERYGNITNEYSVGRTFSNSYGTIAMARQAGNTNSASSEWFFNLGDNSFLDRVDGGFTVFGRLVGGTNALNRFIPPPPTQGIFFDTNIFPELPVLSTNLQFTDLIYVQLELRRDMELEVKRSVGGAELTWNSVAGVTNILEYSAELSTNAWITLTNLVGSGAAVTVADPAAEPRRLYRVKLFY